jgi:hypothetical protein
VRLRVSYVDFERVEFHLLDGRGCFVRPVVVHVGSGRTPAEAVVFPCGHSDGSESLGHAAADRRVRDRAVEELVRLEAAVRALRDRRWVA